MSIYTPYFYIIEEVSTSMYYAGSKYGSDANPESFMKENGYITTSNKIRKLISENGLSSFKIVKLKTFKTANEAQDYETRFLRKIDARNHPRFYNGHNNDWNLYDNKNKVTVIDENGNTFQTDINDPKYKSKELKGVSFGTKPGIEIKTGIRSNFPLNDPRWITGEIESAKKGKSHYKDNYGNSYFVNKKTAEKLDLKSFSKETVTVKDKNGNTFSINLNDPRYISGELVGVTKGMMPVKDKNGNCFVVSVNDERIKTGELVSVNNKMIVAKDNNGNRFRITIDDPRYISGELVGASSGIKFYNNGNINKCFYEGDIIPEGFSKGFLRRIKKQTSAF
jgi:hypothetical protein